MQLRQTPLYECHLAAGAKLGGFAGWELPLSYTGVSQEVEAVRNGVGVFDVSHLARLTLSGPGATASLDRLLTNAVAEVGIGRSVYSPMCNERGGIVDDLIAYRLGDADWLCVVNASRAEGDAEWVRGHVESEVSVELAWGALIAVQGPLARTLVPATVTAEAALLPRNGFLLHPDTEVRGDTFVACTGYTGEDGFELACDAEAAPDLWQRLVEAGAVPCGLAARDVCRLEAGLPLYGHELTEERNPVECGLGWTVKLGKPGFIGKEPLGAAAKAGCASRLIGLGLTGRGVPREGYEVAHDGKTIGAVTSGTFSPTLGKGIAMAFVAEPAPASGAVAEVRIRERLHEARVCELPFYRSESM